MSEIVEPFRATQRINHYSRHLVVLVILDVSGVFNSARWDVILDALENGFRTLLYRFRMVQTWQRDRSLIYAAADGRRIKKVTDR